MAGDPAQWCDYEVAPQPHSRYMLDCPHDLVACSETALGIDNIDCAQPVTLSVRGAPLRQLQGLIRAVDLNPLTGETSVNTVSAGDEVRLSCDPAFRIDAISAGRLTHAPEDQIGGHVPSTWTVVSDAEGRVVLRVASARQARVA
jgi:hypothetical protein